MNIVGIHLGCAHSGLAILNAKGKPEMVPNAEGERFTPSTLYIEGDGSVLVGKEAVNTSKEDVSRSVRWVKRSMGEDAYPETVAGRTWTPAELSSLILRKLKQDCSRQCGDIKDVVITVPAYFDEVRRKATMDAGEQAGLNVMAIINEPAAAALYYAHSFNTSGRIMVFDLGGGTFDVTILDVAGGKVNIVCSQGHHELGGWDFDQRLLERFVRAYAEEKGAKLYETAEEKAEFEELAEDVKRSLSQRPHRKVLLVSGSTRVPMIRNRLAKLMGFEPSAEVNVDECVALGGAIHAGLKMLETNSAAVAEKVKKALNRMSITDVCNHSYGFIDRSSRAMAGNSVGINRIVIPRNTPLPARATRTFYTSEAGQKKLTISCTQGEDHEPGFVRIIFEASIDLPDGLPANSPIVGKWSYDEDGRAFFVLREPSTGKIARYGPSEACLLAAEMGAGTDTRLDTVEHAKRSTSEMFQLRE